MTRLMLGCNLFLLLLLLLLWLLLTLLVLFCGGDSGGGGGGGGHRCCGGFAYSGFYRSHLKEDQELCNCSTPPVISNSLTSLSFPFRKNLYYVYYKKKHNTGHLMAYALFSKTREILKRVGLTNDYIGLVLVNKKSR